MLTIFFFSLPEHEMLRSRMSSIMDLIGPECLELFALDLEKLLYLALFTLWHLQLLTN